MAELITARTRRWVYALYALSSVALSAIQVGYSAGGFEHPVWLTSATAVLGFSRWFSRAAYFVENPASLVALDKQVAPLLPGCGRGATLRLIHKGFRRLTLAADPLAWFASLTRRFTPAAEPAASLRACSTYPYE